MKNIVITGANGFLGSTITAQALKGSSSISSLVRKGSNIDLLPENASIRYVDYSDVSDLKTALDGHEVLIHNAGLTRALSWDIYKKVNVDLTEDLIEIFNNSSSLKHFIFISSQAAAGPSNDGIPLVENTTCNPVSLYGKSKLQAENLIKDKIHTNWTIIRPASVFGPGDKDFLQLYKMIKKHLMLYPLQKKKIFSMIYSEDLASLILSTIDNHMAQNQIFFAANDQSYLQTEIVDYLEQIMTTFSNQIVIPAFLLNIVAEIFEIYGKLSGKLTIINKERLKEFKLADWQVSNKKAKKILDFKPKFEIFEALHRTYQWYLEKGWL
jgi:nucleoside-diphosphate-sugar epimerase